ncbi:MAG: hypothetical protein JJU28_15125 [Cyclobacteriaceae bacterium]|nr:hypothetical protein [Cyclobacteriaceae bacterium]
MKVRFFFGPDKLPFHLTENGMVEINSTMPFHGIISRGLLSEAIAGKMSIELWHRHAAMIGQSLADTNDDLIKFLELAKNHKVLSFGQSALAALKYLERQYPSADKKDDLKAEIWNIKEGHTSSVWKVSMNYSDKRETFVLNVARDLEASKELKETSEKLQVISKSFPDANMAKVLEISSVKNEYLPFEVTVICNEWIENSFEIHCRNNSDNGSPELILVERFITDQKMPTKIKSVLGRRCSVSETNKINKDIHYFLTHSASCLTEKPSLNLNEGDVVWNGEKAIIIAIS